MTNEEENKVATAMKVVPIVAALLVAVFAVHWFVVFCILRLIVCPLFVWEWEIRNSDKRDFILSLSWYLSPIVTVLVLLAELKILCAWESEKQRIEKLRVQKRQQQEAEQVLALQALEQQQRMEAHQQDQQKVRQEEELCRAEVMRRVDDWYAENEAFLDEFPRILFDAWKARHLTEHTSAHIQWDAVQQLITLYQPTVVQQRRRRRSNFPPINPSDV